MKRFSALLLVLCALPLPGLNASAHAEMLELKTGDHIAIIGSGIADRQQHHGWLETLIVAHNPAKDLVFRNLGFAGDTLTTRMRSENFGTPDEWLTRVKADVVFAMFGFNESFAGPAGIDQFKQDLQKFIKDTQAQKYNGKSAPRLVLFAPTAAEKLDDPNLAAAALNNANLQAYAAAMAEVAQANGVPFVDLFHLSQAAYEASAKPLTFNGLHLTTYGAQQLAPHIYRALFPSQPAPNADWQALARLRAAILDKNDQWHARYRTVDGYNVYGGRSQEQYESGKGGPKIKNYLVMQEEMTQRDVLTANRDKRIWAIAKGGDMQVDDSNLPPVLKVGPNREGLSPYLSGEEAIKHMTLAKGCKVELFASEKEFPELVNPVQMAFDTKGRLWVSAWKNYPERTPVGEVGDSLLIFEDTNHDGRADKCIHFLDDLNCPTGFQFFQDGVLIMQAPDLWFVRDTNGDDKADTLERVLMGIDSADSHHTTNAMVLDPGGATYLSDGVFHRTQVETARGPVRNADGCIYRYEPLTAKFERYVPYGFANPHGRVFDYWGNDIVTDATGNANYFGPAFSGYLPYPGKHANMQQFWDRPSRPCPGTGILTSRHFPAEFQNNFLNLNVIGFQGIFRVKVTEEGSGLHGETIEDLVKSDDPNFRPTAVGVAPDGSIYFLDWHQQIIGHLQHHLRDPNRDKTHGRIYRITYEGRPLLEPKPVAGQPIPALLELLKEPENDVRTRAKLELGKRDSAEVIAGVNQWLASLDKRDPGYEHQRTEALWVHQWHNVVDTALLDQVLHSPDYHARAAATRVLCYWRDRVSNSLDLLKQLAADPHPRVRLEAVRAASFFTVPEAIEVPLIAADLPLDYYLTYTSGETMRALEPIWKKAHDEGKPVAFTTASGARFRLKNVSDEQLLVEPRTREVYLELLYRPGMQDEQRQEAIAGLALLDSKPQLRVVMDSIAALDESGASADATVVFSLIRQLTGRSASELSSARTELEKLAVSAKQPILRQIGYAALMNVDGSADNAWKLATSSTKRLVDFVSAVPLVSNVAVRASLYDRIEPLLASLPAPLNADPKANAKGTIGRYVRVELPRKGTLTLAEVEVFSGEQNVARQGRASQKNVSSGGDAGRGIDGNTSPIYGNGGQTHTQENTDNPWWEVDLGEEFPIDAIAIYNRNEGDLGQRLAGFTLSVLDANRQVIYEQKNLPAPQPSARYELGGGGAKAIVRRAAMMALTQIRGQEAKTFATLAAFVRDDADRSTAVRALQRLPKSSWSKEAAPELVALLTGAIRKTPVDQRTSQTALDMQEFADSLASLLPSDKAKAARAELRELGVRVVRINTVFERMAYDQDAVAVRAGKPVEFLLENFDLMPHNFVIVQSGALEEIGTYSEANAQNPAFAARGYVPQSSKVLAASPLLQPRGVQKVSFLAPQQPGVYPFVCTYPGHWRRMYGAIYVVEDLDAYFADPEAYLASVNLPIKDDLLKDRRPRTDWKLADLADAVKELSGRSYDSGKEMFKVASCIACHKLEDQGTAFGPDLAKLDAKYLPVDILKDVIDPSSRINEKFQTETFLLADGKLITALVIEETPDKVKVIENPLTKTPPLEILKSEIDARKKSASSLMPKGLLDKLTRDEILDLIAFLASRGDKASPLFHGAGHQHGK